MKPFGRKYPWRSSLITKGSDWYVNVWREMSDWCTQAFGRGEWEFYDNRFIFKTQAHLAFFLLRWK